MTDDSLVEFIDNVCGDSRLRVEQDFGGGFVRLRSSEAERRQAAQDIRSSEDILIELLRNARDAHARHIFIALQREEARRRIVVIDDGDGIPEAMRERIFEPRVTSKLDTAHMDKWGMHGRGMALYSVSVNAQRACVAASHEGGGTSIVVETDLGKLGEKTDQSTFPRFETADNALAMRGPKNLLRTAAEFSLEHRHDCTVFCGSVTEIAATLYAFGMASTTPAQRAFSAADELPPAKCLAGASDPEDLASRCATIGLPMSSRSARRILDGSIEPLPTMMERIEAECFPHKAEQPKRKTLGASSRDGRGLKLAEDDVAMLRDAVSQAFEDIASRYYLQGGVVPEVRVSSDGVRIFIPVEKIR